MMSGRALLTKTIYKNKLITLSSGGIGPGKNIFVVVCVFLENFSNNKCKNKVVGVGVGKTKSEIKRVRNEGGGMI